MVSVARHVRWAGILAILALTAAAAACGGDSVPEPSIAASELAIYVDEDTILREVFDAFAGSEQACIRGAVDDELLESVLDMLVLSDDLTDELAASIVSCLAPETAREFLLSTIIASLEAEGLNIEVGTNAEACIREFLADIDVATMANAMTSESGDPVFGDGLLGCIHADALREATPVTVGEPAPGQINHDDDVDFFVFEGEQGELYQIDVTLGTLSDSVATLYDSDGFELDYNDDHGDASASRIYWEAQSSGNHYVAVESWSGIGSYTLTIAVANITDDHAGALGEATPVTVGEPAPGEINYDADGDVDFFVFEGEQGEFYQIDVTLGTLSDSVATLYDSDGFELDYNDDHGDASASRIYWEAQSSGNHYVAVESWSGIGSYSLTIAVANITDDHAGALREATPVTVGEPAPGEINYDGDGDFFVFEGEQGEFYQIDVTLGTLSDSVATLYDSDGFELDYNDGYGDTSASRIYWEAQSSGNHYVAVESWSGIGSYSLTIAVANITDDHAGALREATPVTVGEPAPGEINYDGDVDFFVFEGEQGEFYQIDVTLGTLSDSVATLYDSDGFELDYNDDHGDTSASRIYWEAQSSGNHYVAVESWSGIGSYTLTIATR